MDAAFTLSRSVDVGHLLTALTLFAGFVWWLVKTIREWRRASEEDARSGALRLLLKILRDADKPMELAALKETFNADELAQQRRAYCKKRFRFKTDQEFEAAIYRLDWESKIDFVGPHAIRFRVDEREEKGTRVSLGASEQSRILQLVSDAFNDPEFSEWSLVSLARQTYRVTPADLESFLKSNLYNPEPRLARRAAAVLAELASR